jgi:hypothetical protein
MLDNEAIKPGAIAVCRGTSWPQPVVFGVGVLVGLPPYLGSTVG